MPICGQKTSILSKQPILWAKKVNRMPFFSDFSRENRCSHAHILSKKLPFSKKHAALMTIFCQKNVHSVKNTVLLCHFFQIFHEKPPAVMPTFGHNDVDSVKTTLYYGPKNSIGCLFSDFSRKNHCSNTHIL